MDFKENIKVITFKVFIAFFTLCTLLWFAIFSYGIMYYLYIPAVAHIKPVHLQYDMACLKEKICKYPFDNITLIEGGNEFLRGGQGYAIELSLEMPESEHNLDQGMFMIKLDMADSQGRVIKSSRRPTLRYAPEMLLVTSEILYLLLKRQCWQALLHYRSYLFKIIYTLFFIPGLLAGSLEEKQSLVIPLFEKFVEDSSHPSHYAYIEVQAQVAEIYSSTLRIHAQFTGLRYLMYYWPITAAIVGVGSNFLFLVVTISLIWVRETMKFTTDDQQNLRQLQSMRKETKKLSKRRILQKSFGFSQDNTTEKEVDFSRAIKKEKIEIETLLSHPDVKPSKKISRIDDDQEEDEFFDSESLAVTTQGIVEHNIDNLQSSTIEQRIKQILGKKE